MSLLKEVQVALSGICQISGGEDCDFLCIEFRLFIMPQALVHIELLEALRHNSVLHLEIYTLQLMRQAVQL